MRNSLKIQKGFIQISILITIIIGILVVGGGSYFGYTHFKDYQAQQAEKERQVQELAEEQQKMLEEMAKEQELAQQKISELEEKQQVSQEVEDTTLQVSISFIARRVVFLHCLQIEGTRSYIRSLYDVPIYEPNFEGSGVIISSTGEILTNAHVIGIAPVCLVQMAEAPNYSVPSPTYFADVVGIDYNNDLARLRINEPVGEEKLIPSSFSFFNLIKKEVEVGDKIFIAGFSTASNKRLAVTEGIISGREDISGYIPGVFLITSAKVDAGNSGGAAITSKGNLVGLPTYLRGKYETLGYILDLLRVSTP